MSSGYYKTLIVCHYAQGGNYLTWSVYTIGNTCTKCSIGYACGTLYSGLCVSTNYTELQLIENSIGNITDTIINTTNISVTVNVSIINTNLINNLTFTNTSGLLDGTSTNTQISITNNTASYSINHLSCFVFQILTFIILATY